MNFDFDIQPSIDMLKSISTRHGAVNFYLTQDQYLKLQAELATAGADMEALIAFTRGSSYEVFV